MALRIEYQELDGQLNHVPVAGPVTTIIARPGLGYRLVGDPGDPGIEASLVVRRVGPDLQVDGLPDDASLVFSGFFENCDEENRCELDVSPVAGSAVAPIGPESIPIGALDDDTFVMYAPPEQAAGMSPAPEPSFTPKWLGLGLGALAVAGAAGGGGGGGDGAADTTPPTAPVFTVAQDIADATPVLAGTGEPGSEVILSLATAAGEVIATWRTMVDASGAWRVDTGLDAPRNTTVLFDGALPDGAITLLARSVDAAGQLSDLATTVINIDGTVPDGTVVIDRIDDDFGLVIGPVGIGAATDDTLPTLSGSLGRALAPGEVLRVHRNGVAVGDAEVDGLEWRFQEASALVAGSHEYQARIEDAAGTVVAASSRHRIVLDDVAPAPPTIAPITGDDLVDATEYGAGIAVSGSAEAFARIQVEIAGVTREALADESGAWLVRFASTDLPGNGSHAIRAVAIDPAGNPSEAAQRPVVIQALPLQAPEITAIVDDAAPNTGTIARGQPANDPTPRIEGQWDAAAGGTLQILRDGVDVGAAASGRLDVNGNQWSYTDSGLGADGTYIYTARIVSAAGQSSGDSAAYAYRLDTEGPAAPEIDTVAGNDRVGRIEAIFGNLIITGEAEAGSTVHVTWGATTRIVQAQSDGDWAADFTGEVPPVGQRPVSAYAVDAAGNVGAEATRSVQVNNSIFGDAPGGETLKSSDLFVDDEVAFGPSASVDGDAAVAGTASAPVSPSISSAPMSYQGAGSSLATGTWPLDPLGGYSA